MLSIIPNALQKPKMCKTSPSQEVLQEVPKFNHYSTRLMAIIAKDTNFVLEKADLYLPKNYINLARNMTRNMSVSYMYSSFVKPLFTAGR